MIRILLLCIVAAGCAPDAARPIAVRLGEDACAHCRMTIVSTATAAQIVDADQEPALFDDLGCLSNYLAAHPLPPGAMVFVADHRTGEWLHAGDAVFTRSGAPTPMASGVIAHSDAASRDADPAARGGEPVSVSEWLTRSEVRP